MAVLAINFVSASCNETQINVNTASLEELQGITQIGPSTAQEIINYRNNKTFDSVDELINVKYIGESKLEQIKSEGLACVEEESVPSQTNESETEEVEIGENESSKTITATINSVSESNEVDNINEPEISEVIKLNEDANSQDIKSENSFGNLYSNWAIISLGIFSVVIALLLLLKNKKKNELV